MRALVIMSRVPRAGYTKTRLMNKLSGNECVKIHLACLEDLCEVARELEIARYIYFTGGGPDEFSEIDLNGFIMRRQKGKNLGQRLYNAAQEVLSKYDKLLFVGSDVPDLTSGLLVKAFEKLDDHDVVIGPALDGGYYLVGMKQPHDAIFRSIPWGTAGVYQRTISALIASGLSYHVLEARQDIDTWEDVVNYYNRSVKEIFETRMAQAVTEVIGNKL